MIIIIIIVTVVLWYFFIPQKTEPKDEPSTFAADTPELLDPNEIIILHNATDKMLYITASTKNITNNFEQVKVIGMPMKAKSNKKILYNQQELNPDEFISISGILDKKVGISIYSDKKELIKTYTWDKLYTIGKENVDRGFLLAVDITDSGLEMYQQAISRKIT